MFLSRLLVAVVLSLSFSMPAFAQQYFAGAQMSAGYQPWGSGVYGGAQGCVADNSSGGRRIPKEIQDMDDEIDEV
ncbi:MAG: hypothetical protein AABZ31_10330, partial [Bdellovibrionota bacterium]